MTQVATSDERWEVEIEHRVALQATDPTAFAGYLSWKPTRYHDEPGADFSDPEWVAATWETAEDRYFLIAKPSALAVGRWHVFAGIDKSDEKPVVYCGWRDVK